MWGRGEHFGLESFGKYLWSLDLGRFDGGGGVFKKGEEKKFGLRVTLKLKFLYIPLLAIKKSLV